MMSNSVQCSSRRAFLTRFRSSKETSVSALPVSVHSRPPWARENSAFLMLCTRCNQCIDVCPQKILTPSGEQEVGLNELPILVLEHGSCDFCGQCVSACEAGALSLINGRKVQAVAKIEYYCDSAMGQPCTMCVDACQVNAISVTLKEKAKVDNQLCTGCGECALDCHSRAISLVKK